jgi:hypothetical protein
MFRMRLLSLLSFFVVAAGCTAQPPSESQGKTEDSTMAKEKPTETLPKSDRPDCKSLTMAVAADAEAKIAKNPHIGELPDAHLDRGYSLYFQGKIDEARKHFRAARGQTGTTTDEGTLGELSALRRLDDKIGLANLEIEFETSELSTRYRLATQHIGDKRRLEQAADVDEAIWHLLNGRTPGDAAARFAANPDLTARRLIARATFPGTDGRTRERLAEELRKLGSPARYALLAFRGQMATAPAAYERELAKDVDETVAGNPFARRAPLDRFAFATKLLPFTESCNGLSKWAGDAISSIGKK